EERAGPLIQNTQRHIISQRQSSAVDLIEGEPVFYFVPIPAENGTAEFNIQIYQLPAGPSVIMLRQIKRQLIMGNCYQRLDSMSLQLIEYLIIELQSLFVGLRLHPCRINTSPGNAHAKYLKSHFRHQRD